MGITWIMVGVIVVITIGYFARHIVGCMFGLYQVVPLKG